MFKDYASIFMILMLWNVIVFTAYGVDKYFARKNMWRISEKALLSVTLALGGIGAFLGMHYFHHKTQNKKFKVIVPCAAILTILLVFFAKL